MKRQQSVQPTPVAVPQLLTLEQAKARLGLGYNKIMTLHRNEDLPLIRLERAVRVDAQALDEWLEDHGEIVMRMKKEPYPGTAVERAKRSWPSATSRRPQEAKKTQVQPVPAVVPQLLTIGEVLSILKISRSKFDILKNNGEIKVIKSGRSIRVELAEVQCWIEEHKVW